MCGLVGFATTDPEAKLKALFTELLLLSSFRGLHSSGVSAIDTLDGETETLKVVGNPFCLFETQGYNILSSNFKNVWIGHTRHATRGSVTRWNAHPFEYGDIVGAHNGTILNDHDLRKEITNKFGLESDSQCLYAHIAKYGVRDTIPKTRGAWALTFYDKHDGLLYLLKNDERPLFYCFNEDKTIMWWASEWTMLSYILEHRNKVELFRDEEGYAFFPLENDTLYGFNVQREKSYSKAKKEIVLEVEEELKGAEKYVSMVSTPFSGSTQQGNGQNGGQGGRTRLLASISEGTEGVVRTPPQVTPKNGQNENSNTHNCTTQCQTDKPSETSRPRKPTLSLVTTNRNVSLDDSLLYGPDGQLLFSKEFHDLTSDGCLWCSAAISEDDANHIRWVICTPSNKNTEKSTVHVLCPNCSKPDSEAMENQRWIAGAYGKVTEPIVELAAQKLESKQTVSKTKKENKSKKATTKVEPPKKVSAK